MQVIKILNNRYQLITVLKRGGFGTIYKGYDKVLAKDIAVKEINRELLKEAWYVEQFQKEARHVARMNHQNIVHIFDLVQTDDGQFYIVMEYIDGLDVSALQKELLSKDHLLPLHLAVHVVAEICKALDYAHNCSSTDNNEPLNLVHQDISPSNIMISNSGVVKLIDFGIAGVQKQTFDEKDTLMLQGKLQYMSPEHVKPETSLDRRSDIFSLGLVLYELLEGRRFFAREDQTRIIETLRNGKLKVKDFTHTPKPLQTILQRALEKSPDKRYQNANQFYIDLVTYLVLNCEANSLDGELGAFMEQIRQETNGAHKTESASDVEVSEDMFGAVATDPEDPSETSAPTSQHAEPHQEEIAQTIKTETLADGADSSTPTATEDSKQAEYTEAADEVKTIIDVVRLSTRDNPKRLKFTLFGAGALLALFLMADIVLQWTSLGATVYDFIFPPAIKIESVPAGAQVYLDDKLLEGVTPLAVDEIDPGIYELKLTLASFEPIVRSLHVPGKGKVEVKGEQVRNDNRSYRFRFRTQLEIASEPAGADVFINDVKLVQKTPCTITWEVGERCEVKLQKSGFSELDGLVIDTEQMQPEIDDHRIWSVEKREDQTVTYKIRGKFGKYLVIDSNPPDAAIYLNDSPRPIGKTGSHRLFLSARKHKLVLKKPGYNNRTLSLTIDDETPDKLFATLTRTVRFEAYDATNGHTKDLGATIEKVVRGKKTVLREEQTPFEANLEPRAHYAVFSKDGYKKVRLEIDPDDRTVTANMEPAVGSYSVVILDKATRKPLSNVEVRFKYLDRPGADSENLDVTDSKGTLNGNLKPGLYLFRTSKNGYDYQEKTVVIQAGNLNLVEFNLVKQN